MKLILSLLTLALTAPTLSLAAAPTQHEHDQHNSDHSAHHKDADHAAHHQHEHESGHDSHDQTANESSAKAPALTQTPEIKAALAAGGAPVVVDVLGVVCDFCAKAMNRTFGKRAEVAAIYVDLDNKSLSIVTKKDHALDDETITKLVKKAGYKAKAIRRGADALAGGA